MESEGSLPSSQGPTTTTAAKIIIIIIIIATNYQPLRNKEKGR
jgi:hypothetical protein